MQAALAGDGTFIGSREASGTVDAAAWTLVSDLRAGEPPRFERTPQAAAVVPAAASDLWYALGSNGAGDGALDSSVAALAVSGTNLYVGGYFINAAGLPKADYLARWNGSAWSALGDNLNTGSGTNGALNSVVIALAVSDSNVYVGGGFTNAAGLAKADRIARWNGSAWSALGDNGSGDGALNNGVGALAVSGTNLYVGGVFTNAAGLAKADYVAKWNGSAWSALGDNGSGDGALNNYVGSLAVSGSNLYVGGVFSNAAGLATADYVARWTGSAWSALGDNGSGTDGALNDSVYPLAVSDSNVYVGGDFTNAAGLTRADHVARFGPPPYRPDGRIKKGSGSLIGNNVYNTDATGQTRQASAGVGDTVKFTISIQNDGASPDSFGLLTAGIPASGYRVKFFHGTTEITDSVLDGTYQTATVAPGATFAIKVTVKVLNSATSGSSVTGLVRPVSVGDATKIDAVKFIVARN